MLSVTKQVEDTALPGQTELKLLKCLMKADGEHSERFKNYLGKVDNDRADGKCGLYLEKHHFYNGFTNHLTINYKNTTCLNNIGIIVDL